jgi:hypothetical protein
MAVVQQLGRRVELQEVVGHTAQRPLLADGLESPTQTLPKAQCPLHRAEDRLDDGLPPAVRPPSRLPATVT